MNRCGVKYHDKGVKYNVLVESSCSIDGQRRHYAFKTFYFTDDKMHRKELNSQWINKDLKKVSSA